MSPEEVQAATNITGVTGTSSCRGRAALATLQAQDPCFTRALALFTCSTGSYFIQLTLLTDSIHEGVNIFLHTWLVLIPSLGPLDRPCYMYTPEHMFKWYTLGGARKYSKV